MHLFYYKPAKITKSSFFQEVSNTFSQAVNKYNKILTAGGFNIDISNVIDENISYFSDLWDTFNLKNVVTKPSC